jgi:pyruvate dehydrogenase (quinone)
MVKDVLDEASFDASPGRVIPSKLGKAAGRLVDRMRDSAEEGQPD